MKLQGVGETVYFTSWGKAKQSTGGEPVWNAEGLRLIMMDCEIEILPDS